MFAPEGDVRKDTGRPWRAHSGSEDLKEFKCCCCRSVTQLCPTLWDPTGCSSPGFLSFTISQSLLRLGSVESMVPFNHLKEIFTKARSEGSGAGGRGRGSTWGVATSGLPDASGPEGARGAGGPPTWSTADWRGRPGWGCDLHERAGEASSQNASPLYCSAEGLCRTAYQGAGGRVSLWFTRSASQGVKLGRQRSRRRFSTFQLYLHSIHGPWDVWLYALVWTPILPHCLLNIFHKNPWKHMGLQIYTATTAMGSAAVLSWFRILRLVPSFVH